MSEANDQNLDVLHFGEFPQLADALVRSSDAIVSRWRQLVLENLPQAEPLTRKQLDDDVPLLLGWIASALRSSKAEPLDKLIFKTPSHGGVRFHQNYNLRELLIEYHLLRQVMLEEVISALGR